MAKTKINEGDELFLNDEDLHTLKSKDTVDIVITKGKHNTHLKEGSEHKVSGVLASELIESKKAVLK